MSLYDEGAVAPSHAQRALAEEAIEAAAAVAVKALADVLLDYAGPIWRWGDGSGGWVYKTIHDRASERGMNR